MPDKKIKVLLEMRPAMEGFAGIPQEVRLLFRGLRQIETVELEGMLQSSNKILAKGSNDNGFFQKKMSEARKINKFSRVVISAAERPYRNIFVKIIEYIESRLIFSKLILSSNLPIAKIKLTKFESKYFKDFVWRTLFSKTLSAIDFNLVSSANFRICTTPWHLMHMVGLSFLNFKNTATYPRLETKDFDVFISQTPYPALIDNKTAMVVRYHDAIPIFMPHTIPDKSVHQATHFYALMNNVKSNAWFACVSESTRNDLLQLFPEVADRAITIHNMVSDHYFIENSIFDRVLQIVRTRLFEGDKDKGVKIEPEFFSLKEKENFYKKNINENFKYLLIVSTIEPRKNHVRLLAAWEVLKNDIDPNLKLVIVGTLGWDYLPILTGFRSWIDRGEIFMLNAVPSPDLRVLYRHALATICPSIGEGFDFSGIESMSSGGITIASDIPVHREVYADAAEYFDPYSTISVVKAIKKAVYEPESNLVQARLRLRGSEVSSRYLPENILPKWEAFLSRVVCH